MTPSAISNPTSSASPSANPGKTAAFQGALHAFSHASLPQKLPPTSARNGENGALAAASFVGSNKDSQTRGSNTWNSTLNGSEDFSAIRCDPHGVAPTSSPMTSQTNVRQAPQSREQSPSHMAALLATSSTSTPISSSKPNSRRPSSLQHSYTDAQSPDLRVDVKSLIQITETKQASTPVIPIVESVRYIKSSPSRVISPTPLRPPAKPPTTGSEKVKDRKINTLGCSKRPIPPPPRAASMNDPPSLSSISTHRPQLLPSKSFDGSSHSVGNGRRSGEIRRISNNFFPQMSVDSLANAMVASSIASSRAPSPTKPVPPPPRRHGRPHIFHRNHSQELISRTPSPAKGMRQTMREPAKLDEDAEVDYKKRGHFARKHPNKHHEGDRKRYRTQVTEQERKHYEGVWAANRGLLMPVGQGDAVLNVVVRDIWGRSQLSDDILEEVWDLVSLQNGDSLGREEFVVGMWLIDQRLRGNKLPYKVSESVWSSVKRLTGIKVPKK